MARWLIINDDIITNIIESPTSPEPSMPGEVAIIAVTGSENVGDNMMLVLWYAKMKKQSELDAYMDAHFDLVAFIRGGTVTNVTGAQSSAFLASTTNNYRTLRAAATAAANIAAVNAVNVASGWPANP